VTHLCEFYPGICLTTEEKARKTSVRVRKTSVRLRKTSVRVRKISVRLRRTSVRLRRTSVKVRFTYYQKHPHITKPSQTHTLQNHHKHTHYKTHLYTHTHARTHTHTHTLQNNIKPPQYKLKQNACRKSNRMGRKSSI
jgi:hypothetical protein